MQKPADSLRAAFGHDFRLCWKELVLTDIVYKVVAFAVLTPLAGILFRIFVALSGRSVLVDQDILFFFLGPVGWACLVVVGGVSIAIVALEQTALMTIVGAATGERRTRVRDALRCTSRRAWPVLQLTGRMVGLALVVAAPFLAIAGVVYLVFLTRYDINYYLAEKPPAFWTAATLGGVIVLALLATLIWLAVVWLMALPLLLFENVPSSKALGASRRRSKGVRRKIALLVVGWIVGITVLSAVGTGAVTWLGRLLLPHATGSLWILILAVGAVLVLWGAVNFFVTLLGAVTFAVLLVHLLRQLSPGRRIHLPPTEAEPSIGTGKSFRLTRRKVLGAAGAALVVSAVAGVLMFRGVRLEDHAQITAHRGASGAAPENTLAAVERAIADGADWVEVDVQETADGVVVVAHDSDLKKAGGSGVKIWEATAEQLGQVDIGSWFSPEFSDQRVPTLDEVLAACKGKVRLNIELKYYGHDQRLEQRVVERVEACGMQRDVVIMSLEKEAIRKVRSLRPKWKVGLLTAVTLSDLTGLDADFLAVNANLATRQFIRAAHRSGKEVYVWTLNDPVMMSLMIGRGADSVITDEPALARAVLAQRSKMSSAERLLVELAAALGALPERHLTIEDF